MLTTVKGIYENGKVSLLEDCDFIDKSEVLVTFVKLTIEKPKIIRKLGGLEGKIRVMDDFDAPLDDLKEYMY